MVERKSPRARRAQVLAVVAALVAALGVAGAPAAVAQGPAISSLAAGWTHTCALTSTGGVKCWGGNGLGQLGDNTRTTRSKPVDVVGLTSGVTAIAAGGNHTCAVISTGGVKCWGGNGFGGIGDGTTTDRLTPVDVVGLSTGATAIGLGAFHTCAVAGGAATCWGSNDFGQIGDGTTTDRHTPVPVFGLAGGVTAITAGGKQSCARTSTGGAKCWGHNGFGQLGDSSATNRSTPADVSGLTTGTSAVTAGGQHTCARTAPGGAKCWGRNHLGQVGDGTGLDRSAPADVVSLTSGVSVVAAGRWHSCAVTSAGGVKCWGAPSGFGSGDPADPKFLFPVDISGLASGATTLATGEGHTCVAMSAGGVKCFGNNNAGQLGNGTTGSATMTPVEVDFGAALTATTTTLGSAPNPSRVGQAVTFTATVTPSGAGTPTGTVSFNEGATTLGTAPLSGSSATFTTSSLAAGSHSVVAVYNGDANFAGSTSPAALQTVRQLAATADFNGDGTTDIGIFRPSQGVWYVQGGPTVGWGTNGDIPVPADYDGDGDVEVEVEVAIFRPSQGVWYVQGGPTVGWGTNGDIPVPADYDGDAKADIAVVRNGVWYIRTSGPGADITTAWGTTGDIPVPADYDGDGDAEIAIFRPSQGVWYVQGGPTVGWGTNGDIPVPADYDGDAKADIAVVRNGVWYINTSGPGSDITTGWGTNGDIPVPGNYDSDPNTEIAVFRPAQGVWYVQGGPTVGWGTNGDIPLSLPGAIRASFFA